LGGSRRRVKTDYVDASTLEFERDASRTASHIEHEAAQMANCLSLADGPFGKASQVHIGAGSFLRESVIALEHLDATTSLGPVQERLTKYVA
jgi:hypothetical protein